MSFDRLFSVFRVSASGLEAQRKFLEATASNIANAETTETENGQPYVPRRVRFREIGNTDRFGRVLEKALSGAEGSVFEGRVASLSSSLRNRVMSGNRVQAVESFETDDPTRLVYEPDHPQADADGYVRKPNITMVEEMTNLMLASRAYEANITVMNASKSMMKKALEI